jgi:hypothetical protein
MQFRARLAAVNATASKSVDKPNSINVKLEPLELGDPDWLLARLGNYLVIDVRDGPPTATPIEQAIDDMFSVDKPRH